MGDRKPRHDELRLPDSLRQQIIHWGTFAQHHLMKLPKSSSLRDAAAINIVLFFSPLEQTQLEEDNE